MKSIVYDFDALNENFNLLRHGPYKAVLQKAANNSISIDSGGTGTATTSLAELNKIIDDLRMKAREEEIATVFEDSVWKKVTTDGYKTLANGDVQHVSIGHNPEHNNINVASKLYEANQQGPSYTTYRPSYNYSKLYGKSAVNTTEYVDKHGNNVTVYKK